MTSWVRELAVWSAPSMTTREAGYLVHKSVAQLAAGLTCVTSARTILSLSFLFHFALAFASRSRA